MAEIYSFENILFSYFAFYTILLVLKIFVTVTLCIGYYRMKYAVFANKEDYVFALGEKKPALSPEVLERGQRIHKNDIDNIPLFILVAAVYIVTNPSPFVALWHFRIFLAARVIHTISYQEFVIIYESNPQNQTNSDLEDYIQWNDPHYLQVLADRNLTMVMNRFVGFYDNVIFCDKYSSLPYLRESFDAMHGNSNRLNFGDGFLYIRNTSYYEDNQIVIGYYDFSDLTLEVSYILQMKSLSTFLGMESFTGKKHIHVVLVNSDTYLRLKKLNFHLEKQLGSSEIINKGGSDGLNYNFLSGKESDTKRTTTKSNVGLCSKSGGSKPVRGQYSITYEDKCSNHHDIRSNEKQRNYKLLIWTPSRDTSHTLGSDWFGIVPGNKSFSQCNYTNCFITYNKSEYFTSDAVLMHMWLTDKNFSKSLPKKRIPKQKWVMLIGEPPGMSTWAQGVYGSYMKFNKVFNTTWTYHRKSDIRTTYSKGYFQRKSSSGLERKQEEINYAKGKTKMAAWFSSNCEGVSSKRVEYVFNLKQHMEVDIYGKCGTYNCSKDNEDSCLKTLNESYKFYLAFENSICQDYITEKLWKIIPDINIIPVVLGGGKYSEVLPPGSYIDVGDFNSTQDLADYLILVDGNDNLYNTYFNYRNYYEFLPINREATEQCQLCKYINKNYHVTKIYDRLDRFWNQNNDCKPAKNFYHNIDPSTWNTTYCNGPGFQNISVILQELCKKNEKKIHKGEQLSTGSIILLFFGITFATFFVFLTFLYFVMILTECLDIDIDNEDCGGRNDRIYPQVPHHQKTRKSTKKKTVNVYRYRNGVYEIVK